MKKTMYEKIWDSHLVVDAAGQAPLIYVDRHLMHEVTSPQAFEGLRLSGRKVRNPHSILATMDHCVPTKNRDLPIADPIAKIQIETMAENCRVNGLNLYDMKNPNNGVIHVVVPEHGFVHPGMVVVCGDSHTATHGAFGALAFGIGTSEVEHVMATQTLPQKKPCWFRLMENYPNIPQRKILPWRSSEKSVPQAEPVMSSNMRAKRSGNFQWKDA